MFWWQSIILGTIEGLTEFLPISSTGHLIIAQKLMGLKVDEFYTVVIQLGAILASVYYFRLKIWDLLTKFKSIYTLLGIALIPVILVGFGLKDKLNALEDSVLVIALTTIIFGVLFYFIERRHPTNYKTIKDLKPFDTMLIGLSQATALIPGVSRSGATISGGTIQGLNRVEAIEFAFLLGIPTLGLASFYKIFSLLKKGNVDLQSSLIVNTSIGFVVSFIVGLLGIKLTLGLVNKYGFKPFMIYRIALGVFLLLLWQFKVL